MQCPKCQGPAVRVEQTGSLSCVKQCTETLPATMLRKELEGLTADLARLVGSCIPDGYVFTLILSRSEPNAAAYCSNGPRPAVVSMLREMAAKLDADRKVPS